MMGMSTKRQYECDGCNQQVIADQPPSGWMAIRGRSKYNGMSSTGTFLLFGAGASGKTRDRDIDRNAWWCSPPCFKKWLLAQWEHVNREDAQ